MTFPALTRASGSLPLCRHPTGASSLKIEHQTLRVLDRFLDLHQEANRLFTIDQPMVVGQREIHHRPRHDLAVAHHGTLLDAMYAEDAGLRRVEDRGG